MTPTAMKSPSYTNPAYPEHLGFTGTRREGFPTINQIAAVNTLITLVIHPQNVHHGDCIGSDEWFHQAMKHSSRKRVPIVHVHPPDNPRYRAFRDTDVSYEPKPYMMRNQDIVDAVSILIATPDGLEEMRSGTWATIRRARKKGIPIYIIYPNGSIKVENDSH